MIKKPIILAIESSCDDTAAAVLIGDHVIVNLQANQSVHEEFGGVVPELASRAHMQNILPVVDHAIKKANIQFNDIDAIAFTRGPGLIGSLIVGVNFAKAMAIGLDKPIIEVNHMQAHVGAHYIDSPKPQFPFLCLTVSGGHTQIVLVHDFLEMEVIGETQDDAAGEAFDKAAKLFGLPYPGGPLVDQHAQKGKPTFDFTKPKMNGYHFSFSGLKTSILYFVQKQIKKNPNFIEENINDLCASVQTKIVEILMEKLILASNELGIQEIAIGGGVAANSQLRKELLKTGAVKGWNTYMPKFEYCTDNAAMIGIIGYHKYLNEDFTQQDIEPIARYSL